MSITTKDIAKLANVSQSTVSRCLNNSSLVSSKTKDLVLTIASEHNFQFNANARILSTSKTTTIAVVVSKYFINDSFNLHFNQ